MEAERCEGDDRRASPRSAEGRRDASEGGATDLDGLIKTLRSAGEVDPVAMACEKRRSCSSIVSFCSVCFSWMCVDEYEVCLLLSCASARTQNSLYYAGQGAAFELSQSAMRTTNSTKSLPSLSRLLAIPRQGAPATAIRGDVEQPRAEAAAVRGAAEHERRGDERLDECPE